MQLAAEFTSNIGQFSYIFRISPMIIMESGARPVFTTRAAIIIGVAVTFAVGLAVGATILANFIDASSLREYESNPKIVSSVILSDDVAGHNAGWNPGINPIEYEEWVGRTVTENREQLEFQIIDYNVTPESIVYAVVIESGQVYEALGLQAKPGIVETPCVTHPTTNAFTAYCGDENNRYYPKEGTQLKYFVVSPP